MPPAHSKVSNWANAFEPNEKHRAAPMLSPAALQYRTSAASQQRSAHLKALTQLPASCPLTLMSATVSMPVRTMSTWWCSSMLEGTSRVQENSQSSSDVHLRLCSLYLRHHSTMAGAQMMRRYLGNTRRSKHWLQWLSAWLRVLKPEGWCVRVCIWAP